MGQNRAGSGARGWLETGCGCIAQAQRGTGQPQHCHPGPSGRRGDGAGHNGWGSPWSH